MNATTAAKVYRRFEIVEGPLGVVINEVEASADHPVMSGSADWWGHYSREAAWAKAQAQDKPVYIETFDGGFQELGVVFDPRAFEAAVYRGYISYGQSITDGHYAPIDLEAWVVNFRKNVLSGASDADVLYGKDVTEGVREALGTYRRMLIEATA